MAQLSDPGLCYLSEGPTDRSHFLRDEGTGGHSCWKEERETGLYGSAENNLHVSRTYFKKEPVHLRTTTIT